jgi:hypothetical protein
MSTLLDTLVTVLAKDGGGDQFHHTSRHYAGDDKRFSLALKKGVYCYEYMDGRERV